MKKYFTYSAITIACIVLADWGIGKIFNYLYLHQKSNTIYELKYKLDSVKPELLVLGSSRADHHYNTLTLQQITGFKTMNYGIDGTDVFIDYVILSHLLNNKSNNIKAAVIDVKPTELEKAPDYSYITRLYPYINEIKEVKENANSYTKYERIKLLSHTYRYNDFLIALINGYKRNNYDTLPITGFRPLKSRNNFNLKKEILAKKVLNTEAIKWLQKIVTLCKDKHVLPIISISPAYAENIKEMPTYQFLQTFIKQERVAFLYYGDWEKISSPTYYADCQHLNELGANIFSKQFAMDINTMLRLEK